MPLAALIVGVLSFTAERGAVELLYSQPVSRATILIGQMLGVFVALVAAQLLGFGAASLLSSGYASRVLIISVIANPVDAIRTAALLATSGTSAFGSASVAFLRFTKGTMGAAIALCASIIFWTIAPAFVAAWQLKARDL